MNAAAARHPLTLTDDQLAAWEQRGFVSCPGRFSAAEVAVWRAECDRLAADTARLHEDNLRYEFSPRKEDSRRVMWKIDPLVDISPVFRALATDPRIIEPLREIYGGREPSLFKDKLIYKPPGTHGNPLHQDWNWWQPFPQTCLTVTIAIDGGTRENGCTEIFAGHRQGFLHTPGRMDGKIDGKVDLSTVQYFESQPGDFGIFHCLAPHRAGENHSSSTRRQLFLSYNDGADGDLHLAHYAHMWKYRSDGKRLDEAGRERSFFR